jgi:hypothetical protein
MRSEENTPLGDRYLAIEGRASARALDLVKPGLPALFPVNATVLFITFAYADLPLGKSFDVVFPRYKPQDGILCKSRIIAATQEVIRPFTEIPHGWKTISLVEFPEGIPEFIRNLPAVDAWYQNRDWVCICRRETWDFLKHCSRTDPSTSSG